MGNLSEELMAELNCETAFKIPIFGGIPVAESVVDYYGSINCGSVLPWKKSKGRKRWKKTTGCGNCYRRITQFLLRYVRRKRKKVYSLYDDSWNLHCNLKHDWSVWTEITN